MRKFGLYIIVCAVAALAPFLSAHSEPQRVHAASFPGWPAQFEGAALQPLPLTERERRFTNDFPGRIARFTDGKREIIIRWVTEATRKLHPAADCFQGLGYNVKPLPLRVEKDGTLWASFAAVKGEERLNVYERIHGDAGESWTNVSAWYWSALGSEGPWWAITIAEKQP